MKIIHFYYFDSDPRFPPFLLYVMWKSRVNFVRRCFRDVFTRLFEPYNLNMYGLYLYGYVTFKRTFQYYVGSLLLHMCVKQIAAYINTAEL